MRRLRAPLPGASQQKPPLRSCRGRRAARACRGGFTLLEMVLALGISLVLLGALMVALDLHRRLADSGRQDVQRSQLARAIVRMIELDVRSCAFQPDEDAGASTSAASAEEDTLAEEDLTETAVDPAAAYSGDAAGIVGDLNSLVIHAVRPTRDLGMLLDPAGAEFYQPPGDLKSIAWFLAVRGADGLQGAAAEATAAETDGNIVGLARLEGDRLTTQFADSTADVQTLAAGTNLLAEEVAMLEFRYFDGLDWYEAWDSAAYGRLPNAIEITIGFRDPPQDDQPPSETPTRIIRQVVTVPTAEPAVLAGDQTF